PGAAATVAPAVQTPAAPLAPEHIIPVRSSLYRYGISTNGGRVVSAQFLHYQAMDVADRKDTLELLGAGQSALLDSRLVVGADTLDFNRIASTASSDSLSVSGGPATLTLTGQSGDYTIKLVYTFLANDFRIGMSGSITGIGAAGGTMLMGLGNGFRQTEA